ncbi:MAG TPA: hypothetical protein VN688_23835 [Gemmataceae bacterium]|nr:hypothetical protein [Gemmataceae bacterium]
MNRLRQFLEGLHFEGVAPSWWWLWPILIIAGAAFLFWTYHGIFQRSERRLTWGLLALRGLGLLLLVLILSKPTWTRESEQIDPGHVAIIVDNSRSMSLPDSSGATRYDRARAAVEQLKKTLEAEHKGGRLAVDLFDITGTPLKEGMPAQPAIERTDLGEAFHKTALQMRARSIAGLVLVSDGMDNTGRPNFRDWEDTSLPIHGLGFRAGETGDIDWAVRKPQAPGRVLVHNEMRVEVPVSKTGKAGTEATVSIKRGREVLASQKIKLAEGDGEQLVPLTFTPAQPGNFVFTAAVDGATGERFLGNNVAHFPLQVDKEPIKVLYLDGFLRWEYKYLKARLEDDPDIGLVSVVRRISPELPEAKNSKDRLTADRLKQFDVIILGDMEASFLSRPEYEEMVRWLDGKNHSLLVLGGYKSFGPEGLHKTPLADVLPIVFASAPPYQDEEPFQLQLTEKGQGHPIFLLSRDRVKNAEIWKDAPPLQGLNLVQRAKPGAEALAVHPRLRSDGKPAVVLALQRAGGGGQVMVLTVDTTWQWGRFARLLGQNDTLYGRFWSQTIRFLAGRGLDDQRPLLAVSTDKASYKIGKMVEVRVARQPRPDNDLSGTQMNVEINTPSGQTVPVELKVDSSDPDVAKGDFTPSTGGRFELAATLNAAGKPLSNRTAEFLVQGTDLELSNTGTNSANLRALAEATGGVYLDIDKADELAGKIAPKERRTVRVLRSEYWNNPALFTVFLLALTGEWFLRRRNHLV